MNLPGGGVSIRAFNMALLQFDCRQMVAVNEMAVFRPRLGSAAHFCAYFAHIARNLSIKVPDLALEAVIHWVPGGSFAIMRDSREGP